MMPIADRPEKHHFVLTLSCPDSPGIVHAVSGLLAAHGGNITESQQFGDALSGLFFMRVQVETPAPFTELHAALETLGREFGMSWQLDEVGRPLRTLILASREGHCLADLIFRQRNNRLPISVVGVVSNHTDLQSIAEFSGLPYHHVPVTAARKPEAEAQLLRLIEENDVELVVLARYMQVLSSDLCNRLAGRIINIHHSFLPSFKGARPYTQAFERGVKLIGATAHYVTSDLDEGPIIEQDVERVTHSDDARELVAVGQDVERRVLARAVRWHAEHRVLLNGERTVIFR
jgi:formyltetrahydrofolate deformylase